MDNLSSKLTELMQNPGMMEQIRGLAAAFSKNDDQPRNDQPRSDQSQNGQPQTDQPQEAATQPFSSGVPEMPELSGLLLRLLPALTAIRQENEETRFLAALRPLLSESRQKKLDGALRLMQVIRILPMIRETGLF